MKYYYDWPMQVRYYKDGNFFYGIAFLEYIIDLEDGCKLSLDMIYKAAAADGVDEDEAVVELCKWYRLLRGLNRF